MSIIDTIGNLGLIPVVVIDNAEDAVPTAQSLLQGGLSVMEITMRTEAGIQAIKNVRMEQPNMLVGAGTVLTLDRCKEAIDAGAQFIVSPGVNPEIIQWCLERKVAVIPGTVTPTEIETALRLGLNTLKFFPADVFGGINALSALYGPYKSTGVKFIPTGGINLDNLSEYSDKPFIHAVGGGWLCKSSDINSHKFQAITEVVKKSIDILLGFEIARIGICSKSLEGYFKTSDQIKKAFNLSVVEREDSAIISNLFEVLKPQGNENDCYLAIKTNNLDRAIFYLRNRGIEINPHDITFTEEKKRSICLDEMINGIKIRLIQK